MNNDLDMLFFKPFYREEIYAIIFQELLLFWNEQMQTINDF